MESCPSCDAPARSGARFCTTCGYRFAIAHVQLDEEDLQMLDNQGIGASWKGAGWPEQALERPGDEAAPERWQPAQAPVSEQASAATGDTGFWPEQGSSAWSSAPAPGGWPATSGAVDPVNADEPPQPDTAASVQPDLAPPLVRAISLIDELRKLLASAGAPDRSGMDRVISDLEVAVRPPGAIAPERLAELRDALMRARERPRDLDTVVDLSGRVGLLVELMFAYDRSIAAIERSLAVLRPSGDICSGEDNQEPSLPPA